MDFLRSGFKLFGFFTVAVMAFQIPIIGSSARVVDGNTVFISYNATVISQQVNVSDIANTTGFTATATVAKNSWANDLAYLEVKFKNSAGATLFTRRSPSSGWTTLTSTTPIDLIVTVDSTDASWSSNIAKVEVLVGGDDGEYWIGNYGTAIEAITLDQTTNSGTTQLLLNSEFASGNTSWTSSLGWQTCYGGSSSAACVRLAPTPTTTTTPPTTTTTTTTPPTTTTTTTTTTTPPTTTTTTTTPPTTTTTTTTPPIVSSITTPVPALEIVVNGPVVTGVSTTTVAVGQSKIPVVSTPVIAKPANSANSSTTTLPTADSDRIESTPPATPTVPSAPSVSPGAAAVTVGGETTTAIVKRVDNQLVFSVGALNAAVGALDSSRSQLPLDDDGNARLKSGDLIRIKLAGFKPGSLMEVWLFSTPKLLGTTKVGLDGTVTGSFPIPKDSLMGNHRLVIVSQTIEGKSALLTVGLTLGEWESGFRFPVWLIVLPISFAVLTAIALPATRRKRQRPIF